MGFAAQKRGDGIECFMQAFDGSVYRQRYVDEDEMEVDMPISENVGDQADVIDEPVSSVKEHLMKRDNPIAGKISIAGLATKSYPPGALSSEMDSRNNREMNLQNIWICKSLLY
jgi:hypothetical protein